MAAQAEESKVYKYAHLNSSYLFISVAIEIYGAFRPIALKILQDLGHRIRRVTLEDNAYQYLV